MNRSSSCSGPSGPVDRSTWRDSSSGTLRYEAYVTARRVTPGWYVGPWAGDSVPRQDPDDQHRCLLVADDLGLVWDRPIPAEIVAGTELDLVIALAGSEPTAEDDMVLVARMGVQADATAGLGYAFDD